MFVIVGGIACIFEIIFIYFQTCAFITRTNINEMHDNEMFTYFVYTLSVSDIPIKKCIYFNFAKFAGK